MSSRPTEGQEQQRGRNKGAIIYPHWCVLATYSSHGHHCAHHTIERAHGLSSTDAMEQGLCALLSILVQCLRVPPRAKSSREAALRVFDVVIHARWFDLRSLVLDLEESSIGSFLLRMQVTTQCRGDKIVLVVLLFHHVAHLLPQAAFVLLQGAATMRNVRRYILPCRTS